MKTLFKLFLIFILLSCSKEERDERETTIEINSVNPARAAAGSTIEISGSNFDQIRRILFIPRDGQHKEWEIPVYHYEFPELNEGKLKVKIPPMPHEKISVLAGRDTMDFDLFGFIQLHEFPEEMINIQILDDNTAYLHTEDRIFKSTDGLYKWNRFAHHPDKEIFDFYYINENEMVLMTRHQIFTSTNGGKDMVWLMDFSGSVINNLHFKSLTEGYYIDHNHTLYSYKDGEVKDIYEVYPELHTLPFGKIDFFRIIHDGELLLLVPNFENVIIRIENGQVSYNEFPQTPFPPVIFGNTVYLQAGRSLYKSEDRGKNWSHVFESPHVGSGFLFNSKEEIYAFFNPAGHPRQLLQSRDKGTTWKEIETELPDVSGWSFIDFNITKGLAIEPPGKKWKFIPE